MTGGALGLVGLVVVMLLFRIVGSARPASGSLSPDRVNRVNRLVGLQHGNR